MRRGLLIFGLVVAILIVGLFLVLGYLYLSMSSSNNPKPVIEKPHFVNSSNNVSSNVSKEISIRASDISYILNEVGAYKLHNPPFSGNNPEIAVVVDGKKFTSKVISGNINTIEAESSSPDIRITTTKQEVVNIINSEDTKQYLQNSVNSGKCSVELIAGYTELFSKGYLALYKDLTGKSFSGNVIRIFR